MNAKFDPRNVSISVLGRLICVAGRLLLMMGLWGPHHTARAELARPERIDSVFSELQHTSWTRRQGAPSFITHLAQDRDGWLWLGTQEGLYRFDGVKFERMRDGGFVRALVTTPEGDVWASLMGGKVTRRRGNNVEVFDGFDAGSPAYTGLQLDPLGGVLLAFRQKLFRYHGGMWQPVALPEASHGHELTELTLDEEGTMWLLDGPDVLAKRKTEASFTLVTHTHPGGRHLTPIPGNGVMISGEQDAPQIVRITDKPGAVKPPRNLTGTITLDRQGRLWVSQVPEGLAVYAPDRVAAYIAGSAPLNKPEVLVEKEGLSGKHPWTVFQDREGNIWVGTNGGLDRFRTVKFTRLAASDAGQASLAAGDDGIWVGRWQALPWLHVSGTTSTAFVEGDGKPFDRLNCAYRSRDETTWLCGNRGFLHVGQGRIESVPYPPQMGPAPSDSNGAFIHSVATDERGNLVTTASPRGDLVVYREGRWSEIAWPAALKRRGRIGIESLENGLLCVATGEQLACKTDGASWQTYGQSEGLNIGSIATLQAAGKRLWIGGANGLAWFESGRVRSIRESRPTGVLRNISGVVPARDGDLWFNGGEGVGRISLPEVDRLLAENSTMPPAVELFGGEDGLEGTPEQIYPVPTAIEARDGKLWFATSVGTYWVDPAKLRRNHIPPVVAIQGLRAEERSYSPSNNITLPPRPRSVSIPYTALSLTNPERTRFEYRLEGLADQWTDAGNRREAIFTNLWAGHYVFHLRAFNEDGIPSVSESRLVLDILPAFYETWWFRGLCVLTFAALIVLATRWRFARLAARLRERWQERLSERERIARELHDTLLQGLTGLLLQIDAVLRHLPANEQARTRLEKALEAAEATLAEGRDRVMDLRVSGPSRGALQEALSEVASGLAADHHPATLFEMRIEGEPRRLQAVPAEEVFWVGREALRNAFQHGSARHIVLTLTYGPDHFLLRIRDDGGGIAPEVLEAGQRPGHWGLIGMRERADEIGARLRVSSSAEGGTALELLLKGRHIYDGKKASGWGNFAATARSALQRVVGFQAVGHGKSQQ